MPARKKVERASEAAAQSAYDEGEQVVARDVSSDEESDDAPEEESNAQSKHSSRMTDERRRAEQKRKQDVRRKAAVAREVQSLASSTKRKKQQQDDTPPRQPQSQPQRLDPALFEASFAQPAPSQQQSSSSSVAATLDGTRATTSSSAKVNALRQAAQERRKAKRAGGIVRGRDGQPMRDLHDGRTIVRVLPRDRPTSTATDDEDEDDERRRRRRHEETLDVPVTLDPAQMQPSAKASQFKRRKLGLSSNEHEQDRQTTMKQRKNGKTSSKRTADDPLGLEDPAFMKGGEMAHLGTSTIKSKRGRQGRSTGKQPSMLRRGDAGRRTAVMPSGRRSVPVHFARSNGV